MAKRQLSLTMLQTHHLNVHIAQKKCLDDINLQFTTHDYLCIIGPNGAGKSTLLKSLMGIGAASKGSITISGKPLEKISQKELARNISYVAQSHNQHLDFTVADFIKMARYPHHNIFSTWTTDDQVAFDSALFMTDTEAFTDRQIPSLSGGECQRVMIGAALCQQTPFLLLDEPTSFLDPRHQVEVHQLIQNLNQKHKISIIEVTHDINHAIQHSLHILALKEGKVFWKGRSTDFLASSTLSKIYNQEFVILKHPETGQNIALTSEQV